MGFLLTFFSFVLFTIPFGEFSKIFFATNVSITFTDIAVGIFVITWLMYIFATHQLRSVFGGILAKSFFIFILIALFSLLLQLSVFPISIILVSSLYLVRWILYILIGFAVSSFSAKYQHTIIRLLLGISCVLLIEGIIQYIFYSNLRNLFYLGWDDHLYRLFSVFLDPNFASIIYVFVFLFLLGYISDAFAYKEKKKAIALLILAFITLIEILFTHSRSGLLSLIFGTFVYFGLQKQFKYMIGVGIIIGFFLILSSQYFYIENINIFRIVSSEARVETAQKAIKVISDHPILGVGFNTYRYVQLRYGFRNQIGANTSHADAGTDNSLLFVTATTGIIGLIAYVFIHAVVIRQSWKRREKKDEKFLAFVCIASVTALFVDAQFINSLFYPFAILWLWIIIGLRGYR